VTREGAAFYVTGGSLSPSAPSYVERQADRDLYDTLKRGELCYVLDTRQVGKSSLMVRTAARLRSDGLRVASLDLSAAGQNVEPEQWYMGLLYMLAAQMDRDEACEAFWAAHANMSPVLRFMAAVRHCLLPAAPGPLVVFIDEIDAVRSLPFIADELFTAVRAAYNQRADHPDMRRLTFCLIGVATPPDLIRDPRTTPFNVGRRIELTDFTPEEAAGLAAGLGGGEQNAVLFRRIMYWTGGHPYLTQRLCHAVASSDGERCERLVDRVCGATFLTRQAREVDDNLGFVRDRLLSPDAVADVTATLLLYRSLLGRRRSAADDPSDPRVAALRLSGVAKPFDGRIGVRCRIYGRAFDRRWVDRSLPGEEVRRLRRAVRTGVFRVSLVWAAAVALLAVAVGQSYRAGLLQKSLGAVRGQVALARRELATMAGQADALLRQRDSIRAEIGRSVNQRTEAEAQRVRAEARRAAAEERRIRAMAAAEAMSGAVASGLSGISGREAEALRYGLKAVEPALAEGREPPPEALQGLADAVNQGLIRRWRVRLPHRLTGLAFSFDGRRVAVCWDGPEVLLLDPATGRIAATVRAGGAVHSICFTDAGSRLVTFSQAGDLRLWDLGKAPWPRPRPLRTWKMGAQKTPLAAVCLGQTRIACSRPSGGCTVVGMDDNHQVDLRTPHTRPLTALATSEEKGVVATAGEDGLVQVFSDQTGEAVAKHDYHRRDAFPGEPPVYPSALAFTHDRLVSAGSDGTTHAYVWHRNQHHQSYKPVSTRVVSLAAVGSPYLLAVSARDRSVRLWVSAYPHAPIASINAATDPNVMVGGAVGGDLAVADGAGMVELWRYVPPIGGAVCAQVLYAEEASNGDVYFSERSPCVYEWQPYGRGYAHLWESAWGPSLSNAAYHVAPSPTSRAVAAAVNGDIVLWPDRNPDSYARWVGALPYLWALEWTPDGSGLLSAGQDKVVTLWNPRTHAMLRRWRLPEVPHSIRVTRDGRRLVAGCTDGAAYVWEMEGDAPPRILVPPGRTLIRGSRNGVWQAAWSPDGTMVVTADDDGSAYLFHAADGRLLQTLPTETGRLMSAYFSPDGRSILTAGTDNAIRIWDTAKALADGRDGRAPSPRLLLRGHVAAINAATWSPDGRRIITGSVDTTCRVTPATADGLARAAREMLALVAEPRVDSKPVTPLSRKRPPPPRILPP
jgi:WD40 repeat protein